MSDHFSFAFLVGSGTAPRTRAATNARAGPLLARWIALCATRSIGASDSRKVVQLHRFLDEPVPPGRIDPPQFADARLGEGERLALDVGPAPVRDAPAPEPARLLIRCPVLAGLRAEPALPIFRRDGRDEKLPPVAVLQPRGRNLPAVEVLQYADMCHRCLSLSTRSR